MANPLPYKNLSYIYFWNTPSLNNLLEYAHNLQSFYQQNYEKVDFSVERFVQAFSASIFKQNPLDGCNYEVDASNQGLDEKWDFCLRITEIGHLEGGVTERTSKPLYLPEDISQKLLEQKLANIVIWTDWLPTTSIRSFFLRDISIKYFGSKVDVYLLLKIESIRPLARKLRLKSENADKINFPEFVAQITSCFPANDSSQQVTLSSIEPGQIQSFINHCDLKIQSHLSEMDTVALLKLLCLSPEEWFNAKVN